MSVLKILTQENKHLREKSQTLTKEEILQSADFARDLLETMDKNNGIGIAAPQAGKLIRLICIHKDAFNGTEHLILFNPKINFYSKNKVTLEEGCLSVPGINAPVSRPEKIRLKALKQNGEKIEIKAKGLFARVLQHEYDHLEGVLFIDKI